MSKYVGASGKAADKEKNNHPQGRGTDATTLKHGGPVSVGAGNPMSGGGINRPLRGTPQR